MKIPTPEEFAEALKMFEEWICNNPLKEEQPPTGWTTDEVTTLMKGNSDFRIRIFKLRTENIRLTGDLDRANTTIASLCESNHQLAQENETLALQVPPEPVKCDPDLIHRQGRQITDLRDLLTSAHAIAARGGEDTNWEAFIGQLRDRGIGSITAKVFKMPKEDPTSVIVTVTRPAFTRVIGQAWCRTEKPVADSPELRYHSMARIVLCNIHQDVHTGETTYVPISFDDLPQVTETSAS